MVVYKFYLICVPFDACSFDSFDLVSFNYSITDHIHHQRREGRKAKCRQKKTNLSPCSLQYPYEGVTSHTQPTHKRCENICFRSLINNNKHSPKFLFDTISKLLNSPQSDITPMPSNEFEFFQISLLERSTVSGHSSSLYLFHQYQTDISEFILIKVCPHLHRSYMECPGLNPWTSYVFLMYVTPGPKN